jgi:hypothetical protein
MASTLWVGWSIDESLLVRSCRSGSAAAAVSDRHGSLRGSVLIDGSKFNAVNNRDKNFTDHKLKQRMAQQYRPLSGRARPRGSGADASHGGQGFPAQEKVATVKALWSAIIRCSLFPHRLCRAITRSRSPS